MKYQCWSEFALSEGEAQDTEIKILEIGRKVQRGGAGEFEITTKHLEEMVANHEREAPGYEPPAVVGHPKLRDQAPAVGWVKGLRAAADGLYARVSFLGEFASRVRAGEFRYTSPSFSFDWHDEAGASRGAKLLDLGILNNPFQKSLGAFALSEVPTSEVGSDPKDTTMADANVELGELRLKTTQQADEINTLGERVSELALEATDLTTQLADVVIDRDTLKTKLETATKSLAEVQAAKDGDEIVGVLKVALAEGKLSPAQVSGFGTDDFDGLTWLGESPYDGLDGLNKFLKTALPVVDLADRLTVAGSGDGSDAETRRKIEMNAEAALAANPALTREQALELAEANV